MRAGLLTLGAGAALLFACGCSSSKKPPPDGGQQCEDVVYAANLPCGETDTTQALQILHALSLEEKVQQMSGPPYNPNNMFDQEDNERLGIPGNKYMDGPRGVRWYNSDYGTTVYPVAAARASSFDVELERRIGKAMADEMRDLGRHVLLAPTINQVMHPRWGRAQETYGEDTFLLGEMGAALVRGAEYDPSQPDPLDPGQAIQDTYRVQACAKHFAANNIEDTRIFYNAVADDRTLREVYLPHFKKAVAAGASCIMAAYNRVDGSYAGYSTQLLREVLKTDWGFKGFVISDWFAKGNTFTSPVAGLDVEMPFSSGPFPSQFESAYFYGTNLITAVNDDRVDGALVDQAALRILYSKVHHGTIAHAVGWKPYLTKSEATQALALRSAEEGIVLLKNGPTRALADDVLPLSKAALSKVAVVGKFANSENMGDKGSSDAKVVDSSLVITPFEGLQAALPGKTVVTYQTVAGHEADLADADVLLVVTAYFYADLARSSSGEEGEWKDRVSLQLPQRDLDNLNQALALKAAHPNLKLVVAMKSGGAVVVKPWVDQVDALVMVWYAGMKEGTALAELLFGEKNPSGKLCQSFPVAESDLPPFDNTSTGDVGYDYYHGYRWLDEHGTAPLYAFGFGQSYTTFAYSNLSLASAQVAPDGTLEVGVDVKNTGPVAGSEVVQAYVGFSHTQVHDKWGRPVKQLFAFARAADLAPGETRHLALTIHAADLGWWDASAKAMKVEAMPYELYVGPSSDTSDPNTLQGSFTVSSEPQ